MIFNCMDKNISDGSGEINQKGIKFYAKYYR